MLAVLVHKDNPDVCSDPTTVAPGTTCTLARKEKGKALVKERMMEKASYPVKTHGDVDNQIKKSRIEGMKSHLNKIDIDAIIVQVQIMRVTKEILIGSLGKKQYNNQIVHLLGQLPGLNKSKSNDGWRHLMEGGNLGIITRLGLSDREKCSNDSDESLGLD